MIRSLYLHVPFCPQVCPYCDFHKMRRHEGLVSAYLARLEREIEQLADTYPGPLDTVYFGGGTPSALEDAELERVVKSLDSAWGFPARVESTLEADPLTFDRSRLATFRDLGFSRLSIGLQSTQDRILRRLGRRHNGREGLEALELALSAGFEVSADVMTAIPEQDAELDLRAVAGSGVAHVSVYTLTIEPYTPFALRGVKVDEERAADDYELAATVLAQYGLERYEVSSHARPGHESRHNQSYWHGAYFLGVGPSAAGYLPSESGLGTRVTNAPMKGWLEGEPPERQTVSARDYLLERLLTGLRTRLGVDLVDVRSKSGIDLERHYSGVLSPLQNHGLLQVEAGRLSATPEGLMKLDAILRRFFESDSSPA